MFFTLLSQFPTGPFCDYSGLNRLDLKTEIANTIRTLTSEVQTQFGPPFVETTNIPYTWREKGFCPGGPVDIYWFIDNAYNSASILAYNFFERLSVESSYTRLKLITWSTLLSEPDYFAHTVNWSSSKQSIDSFIYQFLWQANVRSDKSQKNHLLELITKFAEVEPNPSDVFKQDLLPITRVFLLTSSGRPETVVRKEKCIERINNCTNESCDELIISKLNDAVCGKTLTSNVINLLRDNGFKIKENTEEKRVSAEFVSNKLKPHIVVYLDESGEVDLNDIRTLIDALSPTLEVPFVFESTADHRRWPFILWQLADRLPMIKCGTLPPIVQNNNVSPSIEASKEPECARCEEIYYRKVIHTTVIAAVGGGAATMLANSQFDAPDISGQLKQVLQCQDGWDNDVHLITH